MKDLSPFEEHEKYYYSCEKWSDPVHFLKAQGKFVFSFPCTLFLHIFDT